MLTSVQTLFGTKEGDKVVGGTLEIESSPGNGTTIYVHVPARFEEEKP